MNEGLGEIDSSTLAGRAYDALREAIISGDLGPREKITERDLAARLAVSPTPIREALRRLEQDGLIERKGPRLVQVVDFDDPAAREVRLAEGALRGVAARLAARNATPEQLARMENLLDAGDRELARLQSERPDAEGLTRADLAPLLDLTREFHAELNQGCNNPVVLKLLGLVDAFSLVERRQNLAGELGAGGGRAALERFHEHRTIFEAVRDGDTTAVERLMREHARVDEYERR